MKRRAIFIAIALGSLGLLLYLGRNQLDDLQRLRQIPPTTVFAILLLYLIARGFGAEVMRVALLQLGHRIAWRESFMLAIVTSYTNLLLPRTGLAPPALYLKKRHGVDYASYISLAIVTMVIGAGANGLIGSILHLVMWATGQAPFRLDVELLFLAVMLAAGGALLAPAGLLARMPARLLKLLEEPRKAWLALAGRPRVLALILGLQLAGILLRGLRLYIVFGAAGAETTVMGVLMASLLADLGTLIGLTPSALGFREAAIVYGASLMAVAPSTAIIAALLDRLIWSVGVMVLGQVFLWRGMRALNGPADGPAASSPEGAD